MSVEHAIYLLAVAAWLAIRAPYVLASQKHRTAVFRGRGVDWLIHVSVLLGVAVLPFFYLFSTLLDFANYNLPALSRIAGSVLLGVALVVLWRGHADLGLNFSPVIETPQRQALVMNGIYSLVRHPIYTHHLLWALAQPLVLHNWFAGGFSLISFAFLYLLRIPSEEAMLLKEFGHQYRSYTSTTGRLIPRLRGPRSGRGAV
jgi:protein-S-isoprenylcysteine O-methyltransferase Ste14